MSKTRDLSQLIKTLASNVGASLIGFIQAGTGAVTRTIREKLLEQVSVFDFMTVAQIAQVKTNTVGASPVSLSDALDAATAYAATKGLLLKVPEGLYYTTRTWNIPSTVTVSGQSFSFPKASYTPTDVACGAVIFKAHNSDAVVVTGTGPYSESAGITNLTVVSNQTTYTSGGGFVVDKVGIYYLDRCTVWACAGNGFTIGTSAGDVTGQVSISNLYVNNCGGYAYNFRTKWLTAINIKSDGCTWGAWLNASPETYLNGFHFEGFLVGGIKIANGSTACRFNSGFLAMTNVSSTQMIVVDDTAGNGFHKFTDSRFIGRSSSEIGAYIGGAAWGIDFKGCIFNGCFKGVQNFSKGLRLIGCTFDTCETPVEDSGTFGSITECFTVGTTGSYSIVQTGGANINGSVYQSNVLDKPPYSSLYTSNTNFGKTQVKDNIGFVNSAVGQTAVITSGTAIPHGLDVAPIYVSLTALAPFSNPTDLKITISATSITPTWSGGSSIQFCWKATAV